MLGAKEAVSFAIHADGTVTIQPPSSNEGLSKHANVYKISGMKF